MTWEIVKICPCSVLISIPLIFATKSNLQWEKKISRGGKGAIRWVGEVYAYTIRIRIEATLKTTMVVFICVAPSGWVVRRSK